MIVNTQEILSVVCVNKVILVFLNFFAAILISPFHVSFSFPQVNGTLKTTDLFYYKDHYD